MRKLRVIALALVVTVALSGCTVLNTLGSAADEARMSSALDDLDASLAAIPGITSAVSSMPIRGDLKFDVTVSAKSDGLTMENQRRAADAVIDLFTAPPFSEQPRLWFSISEGPDDQLVNRLEFDLAGFSRESIDGELDYLDAFAAVAGQVVTMSIYPAEPENGFDNYTRGIGITDREATIDWAALRAVPDVTTGETAYSIGAVHSRGGLIPEKLEALGARVGGTEDSLYWNANEDYLALNILSEEQDDDFESLPAWGRLVDVALAAQSSKAGLDFIGLGAAVGASAYFGECDDPKVDGIADDFVDALTRAGIRGAKPGVCISTMPY